MKVLSISVLLFVLALLVFYVRRGAFPTLNIMSINSLKWVLGVYAAVLLFSIMVLYMLPKQGFALSTTNNSEQFSNIWEAAKGGKLNSAKGVYAKSNWSFEFSGSRLKISSAYPTLIFVQRKDRDDGRIDVVDYVTSSAFDGIDYTDKIKPPQVALARDELMITGPGPYQVNYVRFEKDFAAAQFSNGNADQTSSGFSSSEALVLRIPKTLNLDASSEKIVQFVGE